MLRARTMDSLHDLVGQRFVVDFPGTELGPEVERLVREGRVGGVILFPKNVTSPEQVRTLVADLQRLAREASLPPLWITVDQEGGWVNALRDVPLCPSPMALGASGEEADAYKAGRITGSVLRWLGVNANHAPVLDVNTNPRNPVIGPRSFGEDPRAVARLGCAYLRGLRSCGVLGIVKHFPGHGDTGVDSHLDLPVVRKERAELERVELAPFRASLEAGAEALMTAHVLYPALDPDLPATFSSRILRDLLRGEMGFEGAVFTDALGMGAVRRRWNRAEAVVHSLRAGADVVLNLGSPEEQWAGIEAAREAARDGRLAPADLDGSMRRLCRLKDRYAVPPPPEPPSLAELRRSALHLARRGVTLVRAGRVPLPPGPAAVLSLGLGETAREVFVGELRAHLPRVEVVPSAGEMEPEVWETLVVLTPGWRETAYTDTVRKLWARYRDRLVVVGAGAPYELAAFPEVHSYLVAYGPDPASLRAAAWALVGRLSPTGRLPVTVPGAVP
ncbi:MAG: beta-N-acetylhexosaminidase [Armatimonadota bacterium]|nr:beta-N-acetylhexosaminidase [Armatimonadota bacterium]MDR7439245.1 beta-N-acetylhexosaminidase [Armatimonadota bacterium]MDR7563292.1 beta-N-acetylhexosaminidase [Armatimonadota bacterium]MDR7602646.1 beta-N-acetylhexosaminidase [Armatimonadota bacterium]